MKIFFPVCMLVLSSFTLSGCHNRENRSGDLRIALLKGPSAISLFPLIDSVYKVEEYRLGTSVYVNPLQIQALMIRGEADIVALPVTLAANLYNRGLPYVYLGCTVWGNLYWISRRNEDTTGADRKEIYLFGKENTPDILLRHLQMQPSFSTVKDYIRVYTYDSPEALVQALLSGVARDAVLPEPFVSTILAKDTSFYIRYDLARAFTEDGFPQTALMIKQELARDTIFVSSLNRLLGDLCVRVNSGDTTLVRNMMQKRMLPEFANASEVIARCRIRYVSAPNVNKAVGDLLNMLYLYQPKSIGGQIPDSNFFVLPTPGL